MMLDNLITQAVARIDAKLLTLDASALASVEANATLTVSEWLALGDKSSLGLLNGLLDADSAQTLHAIHSDFQHGATLAQRVVFLQAMTEIMGASR